MQPITNGNVKSQLRRNLSVAIIGVVLVAIISVVTIIGLSFWQKNTITSQVKNDLNKVVSAMATKKSSTGAYPNTIADVLNLSGENVELSGGSSFDGTTYCIAGTSKSDKSIVFHVDSTNTNKGPLVGTCTTGSDISTPLAPGNIAVAFASSSEIKLTWDASLYATNYKLQCAIDSQFTTVASSTDVTNAAGLCNNLKSNMAYYCRVKAVNKKGSSDWSTAVRMSTLN
jgi:type II secretory pathway pseudopilin PulG